MGHSSFPISLEFLFSEFSNFLWLESQCSTVIVFTLHLLVSRNALYLSQLPSRNVTIQSTEKESTPWFAKMSTSGSVGQPAKIKQTDCFAECPLSVLSVSCWFSPSRCLFPPVVVTHNYSISTRFAVSIHDRQRPRTDDSLIRVFCFWTAIHNRPLESTPRSKVAACAS